MKTFDEYVSFYDLFYADKDYSGECAYLCRHLRRLQRDARSLLELGVGTGRHALNFWRLGINVSGVDLSPGMLAQARETWRDEDGIALHLDDVRTIRLAESFDVVERSPENVLLVNRRLEGVRT